MVCIPQFLPHTAEASGNDSADPSIAPGGVRSAAAARARCIFEGHYANAIQKRLNEHQRQQTHRGVPSGTGGGGTE